MCESGPVTVGQKAGTRANMCPRLGTFFDRVDVRVLHNATIWPGTLGLTLGLNKHG